NSTIEKFASSEKLSAFVRANLYAMRAQLSKGQQDNATPQDHDNKIVLAIKLNPAMVDELAKIKPETTTSHGHRVYMCDYEQCISIYKAIYVSDVAHRSSRLIFVEHGGEIVASVVINFPNPLLKERGQEGLSAYSEFDFSHKIFGKLRESIELCQWYLPSEYDSATELLTLMWQSIGKLTKQGDGYNHILTMVDVPDWYNSMSKILIVKFLRHYMWDEADSSLITPRHRILGLHRRGLDSSLAVAVDSGDLLQKILSDIEQKEHKPLSLLQFLIGHGALGASFNTNSEFEESLHLLFFIDTKSKLFHVEQ
ncbi:MAG: hypothetical protein RSA50_06515, partial [Mucinivorans sp.]